MSIVDINILYFQFALFSIIIIIGGCFPDVSGLFSAMLYQMFAKHLGFIWSSTVFTLACKQYLSEDMYCSQYYWSLKIVDIVESWDFSQKAFIMTDI